MQGQLGVRPGCRSPAWSSTLCVAYGVKAGRLVRSFRNPCPCHFCPVPPLLSSRAPQGISIAPLSPIQHRSALSEKGFRRDAHVRETRSVCSCPWRACGSVHSRPRTGWNSKDKTRTREGPPTWNTRQVRMDRAFLSLERRLGK